MLRSLGYKPKKIFELITSEDYCDEYQLELFTGKIDYLYKIYQKFTDTQLKDAKEEWRKHFKEPLTEKEIRILERVKLYKDTKDPDTKRKILNDIADEVGEDKRLDAISKSGSIVNISIAEELKNFLTPKDEQSS